MKKYFPYLILVSALLVSSIGSFYSIYGIGKIFGGHQFGATLMAFALEFGNIITATSLKVYWKFIPNLLRGYLIIAVIVLTCLTSLGIYGYLSDGYQLTAQKDEIVQKRSGLVKLKKDNFQLRIDEWKKELEIVNNSILDLTKGLNTNSQTQQIDKKTGQVITNVIVGSKKSIDNQLMISNDRKLSLNSKIDNYQDSIQRLELQIIDIESNNSVSSELGPLKYLSNLTGQPMNKIVNWFLILIMIVFQPLAIALILLSLFAFKNNHYLNRTSRKPKDVSILDGIKLKFNDLKNKIIKPKIVTPPIVTPAPVKVKRKYTKRVKNTIDPDTTIAPPNPAIIEPEKPKSKRPRKIVDTNLTAGIADHIASSLTGVKKKYKSNTKSN